jgi:hypothetical protein
MILGPLTEWPLMGHNNKKRDKDPDRLCSLVVLATDPEARVRFPALPEQKSSGSGTGSTQPREYNWGATW